MADSFDFHDRLGAGYFGEVWRATDTGLNAERALKLVPPSKVIDAANFFRESQTLKSVEHPNIVRVEETGTMADGRQYVAMEYLKKGSVEDEARGDTLPLTRTKRLMIDVLRGLGHAHNKGIIHRDVKPANILVGDASEGKLSDFGLAMPAGIDLKKLGVKEYAYTLHLAPEINGLAGFSIQSDIYACGVTLYRLINGDSMLPSLLPMDAQALAKIGKFPDRSSYRHYIPRPLRTLVNKAMHVDPAKRYQSADAMRHALERITLEKNWREKKTHTGAIWTCGWDNKCYTVEIGMTKSNDWEVVVKKGRTKRALRTISNLSLREAGVTKARAHTHAKRILQDYVLGRIT